MSAQPTADRVIEELFANAPVEFLQSAISREEGLFLKSLAARPEVHKTIEIGCANGVSSIYICAGLAEKQNVRHTAIDPYQTLEFQGRGAAAVRRAGYEFFDVIEQPSEVALPALLASGARYDMALIDGLHTADQTLIDFYYLDRMVQEGGVIAIDDVNAMAVNKIVRYVSTYPNYKLIGVSGKRGLRRRVINILKHAASIGLWPARKILGEAFCREFYDISLIHPETLWTIDFHSMVAFQKTGQYTRGTTWYHGI